MIIAGQQLNIYGAPQAHGQKKDTSVEIGWADHSD